MKQRRRPPGHPGGPLRRTGALLAAGLILSGVWITADARDGPSALRALENTAWLTRRIIQRELAVLSREDTLPAAAVLALSASPVLAAARQTVLEYWDFDKQPLPQTQTPSEELEPPVIVAPTPQEERTATENGVPAKTIVPGSGDGYTRVGQVYIANGTDETLDTAALSADYAPATTEGTAPTVLLIHTHGSEAYTMPPGQEYEATAYCRTIDSAYNVVRVGDEIAAVLSQAGLSVLHDRTLHDYPKYGGSYDRSLVSALDYLEQYPSIVYILDIHRDAIEDADGTAYKLICREEPNAAQLSFVVGSDGSGLSHPDWERNLHLATAVQQTLLADYPTLLRPITLRNSRYNQHLTPGTLLVEVGAAGNSLEEALCAARLFAQGFAQTVGAEGIDREGES